MTNKMVKNKCLSNPDEIFGFIHTFQEYIISLFLRD